MSFNSIIFLIFFGIVCVLYYLIPKSWRWVLLLIASCYFYMAFIPAYILILFYLIAIDYVMGRVIEQAEGKRRKWFLIISIIANVGTLFFFKYFNFFETNVVYLASVIHWNYSPWILQIALPLGLSFHTFQSLAYVIEVYKKRYPAERHLGIYALYVMFFPQLVAGPIERPQHLLPQLHSLGDFDEARITDGLKIMLWGFFKKVVVADTLGSIVDSIYGNLHAVSGASLTLAVIAFALQLYGDFSGYSDIARGAAKIFGVDLTNNFNLPYFSRSIADFWRRWHISLSSWFRDYFYQPIALSWTRISKAGPYLALIVTFLVIGLWHGAAWHYVFFGGLFGVYMVFGQLTKSLRVGIARAIGLTRVPMLYAFFQTATTFILVCIGFVFFRAASMGDALYLLTHFGIGWGSVFHKTFWTSGRFAGPAFIQTESTLGKIKLLSLPLSCLFMIGGEYLQRRAKVNKWLMTHSPILRWAAYYALVIWIIIFGYYAQRTFIYFQF